MNQIIPVNETEDSVTITRSDWEHLLDRLEDAEDLAAVRAMRADETSVGGYQAAKRNYFTIDEAKRLLAGERAVRVWRQKRGLTQRALAAASGIPPGYLSEIETGKKPGSIAAYRALSKALEVSIEDLVEAERHVAPNIAS